MELNLIRAVIREELGPDHVRGFSADDQKRRTRCYICHGPSFLKIWFGGLDSLSELSFAEH